tara:strand:+ start:389 stop:1087 length:699 start_codon:yes stop_codon:yes gene_type:complete
MALPSLKASRHELILPSTGEKVQYRPFLVKEEKLLLIAQNSENQSEIALALETIVDDCTFNKLNVKELPTFDIEYIFIQLRSKSVGSQTTIQVTCPDDNETKVAVDIDLNDIQCVMSDEHNPTIELTNDIGMIMSYPKLNEMSTLDLNNQEVVFDLLASCVKQIYDSDNVYEKTDMNKKELNEFIDSMTHEQLVKVQKFFETMPKVKHTINVVNPNTNVESEVVIEGMNSFF